jgi:hypothetical protein
LFVWNESANLNTPLLPEANTVETAVFLEFAVVLLRTSTATATDLSGSTKRPDEFRNLPHCFLGNCAAQYRCRSLSKVQQRNLTFGQRWRVAGC